MDDRPNAREVEVLEAMVEGAEDGLLVVDGAGRVLDANRSAETLGGFRTRAVRGRRARDIGGALGWTIADEAIASRVIVSQVQTPAPGRKILLSARPVLVDGGAPRFCVLTVRDVSELDRLLARLEASRSLSERYRRALRTAEATRPPAGRIVAQGPTTRAVQELALKYAAVDSPVLVLGETGTGKGVFSRLIHEASPRAAGPFIEINCGAIPEALMEAELFGYARGAFTGADPRGKPGLIELAHAGTLLLDEIGDLPTVLQVKLLRFLEEGEIWPVGGVRSRRPSVRILAATQHDLATLMTQNRFRRDLFYRLNVLTLRIPPLRERRDEIPALVAGALTEVAEHVGRRVTVTPTALALIGRYDFPGNVRELRNLLERLVVTAAGEVIDVADLPPELAPPAPATAPAAEARGSLRHAVEDIEANVVRQALERYGTQTLAARHLGVSQATVARRARRYGLTR